ncbi:PD-(D/E)XK nuclease-like domain-containing protein [Pseudaminobacter sp. NGMCC 1.201702]|uniref:PD-(D/E)XK nuclease-like domain-containing protein n=1 Tax=Pseudaminobacter sp. NGMCC 1.201702 TaxID=3391825 RepID=UPI0039F10C5B
MNRHVDIDQDRAEHVSAPIGRMMSNIERQWDGNPITTRGVYSGISLEAYHRKPDLFDAPSVSKSILKWMLPAHGGSPKAFWGRWAWNPNHIEQEPSEALDFGKAAHCLLLGDEVFEDGFALRPKEYPDYRTKAAQEWRDAVRKAGKTVVTPDQMERIRRIHADASTNEMVKLGVLNGRVERTICWKDRETGIWLKVRPDAMPNADGVFADLKTAGKFDEDFLERQIFDAGYYLQAAMIRMVCRELGIPFETFVLVYVLNDDVPDTAHVEMSSFAIDRGERAIRWCLNTIRQCLDKNEWPGARPFEGGERAIQMKPWAAERLDFFLDQQDREAA